MERRESRHRRSNSRHDSNAGGTHTSSSGVAVAAAGAGGSDDAQRMRIDEDSCTVFPFQVSGHDVMFRTKNGLIIKMASVREIRFYERVMQQSPELAPFLAAYAGRVRLGNAERMRSVAVRAVLESTKFVSPWTLYCIQKAKERQKPKKPGSEFIAITDLTLQFKHPNIIDIKLGTLHHSQDREVRKPVKYKTAVTLGYCIGGKLKWDENEEVYHHIDKYVGRELDERSITSVLADFVCRSGDKPDLNVVDAIVDKLQPMMNYFDEQRTWRFHSTSLLVLYEVQNGEIITDIRLVDFAHAYLNHSGVEGREMQLDQGCRLGISSLIRDLRKLKQTSQ